MEEGSASEIQGWLRMDSITSLTSLLRGGCLANLWRRPHFVFPSLCISRFRGAFSLEHGRLHKSILPGIKALATRTTRTSGSSCRSVTTTGVGCLAEVVREDWLARFVLASSSGLIKKASKVCPTKMVDGAVQKAKTIGSFQGRRSFGRDCMQVTVPPLSLWSAVAV